MRSPDPLSGVPNEGRYPAGLSQDRWRELNGKGPAGTYNHVAVTLEDEANNGGWLPGARPTGPDPRDLWTIGMRGEPGYDDDPSIGTDGQVSHNGAGTDNSSYD